jgi:K+-transporting ATPase KdpF subunit
MTLGSIIMLAICAAVTFYLLFALLKPEKF